jgi:hypothetical protein
MTEIPAKVFGEVADYFALQNEAGEADDPNDLQAMLLKKLSGQ